MMNELKEVKKAVNPTEVLLVVDAMTGQEAAVCSCILFNYHFDTSVCDLHDALHETYLFSGMVRISELLQC
jgi:methyl coenzyme M reductase subunit C-like uncharacterized protein (methanogenesis marker protein 7)